MSRPPLIEEIMVPSVSELVNASVQFAPTNGDLSTVAFDAKMVTFHLPVVTLDCNTEVMLRNLVAYVRLILLFYISCTLVCSHVKCTSI